MNIYEPRFSECQILQRQVREFKDLAEYWRRSAYSYLDLNHELRARLDEMQSNHALEPYPLANRVVPEAHCPTLQVVSHEDDVEAFVPTDYQHYWTCAHYPSAIDNWAHKFKQSDCRFCNTKDE